MSKTTKPRPDKHGKAAPVTNTPQQANPEIILGKFTESDWLAVLQLDDTEDYVGTIVQDIQQVVDEKIKEIEIERQLAPYTVNKVMSFVMDLFKLAYPEHQNSQRVDAAWDSDFAPACSTIDSWAEGSVPRHVVTTLTVLQSRDSPIDEISEEQQFTTSNPEPEIQNISTEIDLGASGGFNLVEPSPEEGNTVFPSTTAKGEPKRSKQILSLSKPKPFKPNVSVLSVRRAIGIAGSQDGNNAELRQDTDDKKTCGASSSSASKMAASSKGVKTALVAAVGKASLQREKGRPPMEKDVNYDAFGNIISMIRISPDTFPPLFVQTDYTVVDPRVERANAELEAMRTGRYIQRRGHVRQPIRLKPLKLTPGLAAAEITAARAGLFSENLPINEPEAMARLSSNAQKNNARQMEKITAKIPQAKTIIEQIDLSAGVEIREGTQEKRGADLRSTSGAVFLQQDSTLLPMTQKPQVTEKLMEIGQFLTKAPSIKPIA